MKKLVILAVLGTLLAVSAFAHGHGGGHHGKGRGGHGHYHGNVWCTQNHW